MYEDEKRRLEAEINNSESRILDLKAYLSSKDYQTIREAQGGEPMDAETKQRCADAREEINDLENVIQHLREDLEKIPEDMPGDNLE